MPSKENADAFSRWEEERAFSRISPVDKADFDKLDSRLKFAEWIDDPKEEQLGRALSLIYLDDSQEEDEQPRKPVRVGRIFPLAVDDSTHLIVFKNRRMVIIEPLPPSERVDNTKQKRLNDYKEIFAFKPNESLYCLDDPNADIDEQIGKVIYYLSEHALVTKSNDTHDGLPTFNTDVMANRALSVSKRVKEKREQQLDRDAWVMMETYEKQFGTIIFPPKNQRKDDPPA